MEEYEGADPTETYTVTLLRMPVGPDGKALTVTPDRNGNIVDIRAVLLTEPLLIEANLELEGPLLPWKISMSSSFTTPSSPSSSSTP